MPPKTNNELSEDIIHLKKDYERLVDDMAEVKLTMEKQGESIRVLEDASLTQPAATEQLILKIISHKNNSWQMKMQSFAPYFAALLLFTSAMIINFGK